jgi:hypothetical protein
MCSSFKAAAAALTAVLLVAPGCTCDQQTSKRSPKIELPLPEGGELSLLDFGTVQVDVEQVRDVRVRNGGTAALTVSALTTAAPFSVKTDVPLVIGVGQEEVVKVAYRPVTADQPQTGKLTFSSDDRAQPERVLNLAGQGIQAVAVASPSPIDFRDVYLGESRKVTVTLTNAGSNDLDIKSAVLDQAPATVTGDLSPLQTLLGAGKSVTADLTFAPTEMAYLTGTLEITPDPLQGQKLSLPLAGRGVISKARMCWKPQGGTEVCTDPNVSAPALQARFPSRCDTRLYPFDSGVSACTPATSDMSGEVYFRNEGNIPVGFAVQYVPYIYGAKDRCDAGYPPESDFTFSNAPVLADGGAPFSYTEGSPKPVLLPSDAGAAKPWESAHVTVSYRARSRCAEEASDLARVVWTRQNEPLTHVPQNILLTIDSASKLPHAVTSEWSCGAVGQPQQVPCTYVFYGANNSGDAPLNITNVELWEETPLPPDSGITDAGGPNGGFFAPCTANPYGSCAQFGWGARDGGDPNQYAPHIIPATTVPGQTTQKVIGTLVFGPSGASSCPTPSTCACSDGGTACATPNRLYSIYAVITTDDPYGTQVTSKLQGVAAPGL